MRAERITVDGKTDRDALMEHDAPAIFVALEASGFAAAIRQSIWIYPFANVGHIVALVCFAGAIAVMDLRPDRRASRRPRRAKIIGRARRVAIAALLRAGRHRLPAVLGRGEPRHPQPGVPDQDGAGRGRPRSTSRSSSSASRREVRRPAAAAHAMPHAARVCRHPSRSASGSSSRLRPARSRISDFCSSVPMHTTHPVPPTVIGPCARSAGRRRPARPGRSCRRCRCRCRARDRCRSC